MPQQLTQSWKDSLGIHYKDIYDKYLHTFANLTLTAYNSNYGNHSFMEKKEGYINKKNNKIYGFKDSTFKLSNYLKTISQWTENEIKERGKLLESNFLHLWPMITTSYVPLERESDIVSFDDDDVEVTNRYIQAFIYRGVKHKISTWKGMLVEVCKLVYEENPTLMSYFAQKGGYLQTQESANYLKIAENVMCIRLQVLGVFVEI